MTSNKLPVGCILMTHSMYADLLIQPATVVGSNKAGAFLTGEESLNNFFGYKIITTNKSDILPDNKVMIFAPEDYLGQFYSLQEPTVFLKTEADQISFRTYEAIGAGIGNTNGIVQVVF
jgi:hypothetical protein